MDTIKYLTEKQVSAFSNIAVQTLRNWRQTRKGFPYIKVGRSVRYSVDDVEAFMEARRVETQEI